MTTGNFADQPAPVDPYDPAPSGLRLPADYYNSPASDVRPIFAKWLPFAAGIASIVFLIVLTAFGADVSRNGLGKYLNLLLAPAATAIPGIYAKDVPETDRKQLAQELAVFRTHIRENRINAQEMQPVLELLQGMVRDQKMTTEEVRELSAALRSANAAAK